MYKRSVFGADGKAVVPVKFKLILVESKLIQHIRESADTG